MIATCEAKHPIDIYIIHFVENKNCKNIANPQQTVDNLSLHFVFVKFLYFTKGITIDN